MMQMRKSQVWAGSKGIGQEHGSYKLDIFVENSLNQGKCSIKIRR